MKQSPVRRAQLVAPFGVGAMFTAPDGTGMITAGLDGWFDSDSSDIDLDEYRVSEWRLEHSLRVAQLRLPPDYRRGQRGGIPQPNLELTIPALRFPAWHFCPNPQCRALVRIAPHHGKRRRCPECERRNAAGGDKKKRYAPFLAQVPFIALCEAGHLEDFPWREWVHRTTAPQCNGLMRLRATGGATLAAQTVHCECGIAPRNLSQITEAYNRDGQSDTFLSANLADGEDRYLCCGWRPWVDDRTGHGCGLPVRGSLRASTAAYYSHVISAIYLPGGSLGLPDGLVEALERAPLKYKIDLLHQLGQVTLQMVRKADELGQLKDFDDADITQALDALSSGKTAASQQDGDELDADALRRPEFNMLRNGLTSEDLIVNPQDPSLYADGLDRFLSRINLIEQLRETRVMYGFSRIEPDSSRPLPVMKAQLWNQEPDFGSSWLPAYVVRGEGIFVELNPDALAAWERRPDVNHRLRLLAAHPLRTRASRELQDPAAVPRFVLLHTFAHLLINQLVFECGYSSASLRERLFCSSGDSPMAGVLIYTAAGDSEGTMGGLVRMGKAGLLEPAIVAALERAQWCSSDPVCMELGERGQGPRSMNLAACHACGLLPETACEVFNTFLDRATVTGTHDDPGVGFFHGY